MNPRFAIALAKNLRRIAELTAEVALIDSALVHSAEGRREEAVREADKAEASIASLLTQPGAFREDDCG